MTERVTLGASDEGSRWIGVRRHQAATVIVGLGLTGDWLIRANASLVEGVVGVLVAVSALPALDALTIFELVVVAGRFLLHSRWTGARALSVAGATEVLAGGRAVARGFELIHHGRLDLSGRDEALSEGLVALADGLSQFDTGRHFSVHVLNEETITRTALVLSPEHQAPEGWRPNTEIIEQIVNGRDNSDDLRLERWRYLRDRTGVLRVLRISDFSGTPAGSHVLERLQASPNWAQLSLHVEVLNARRAQTIAARAVHRSGSDVAATSSVGFRRTARTARAVSRLRESERLVANGRSLLQIGIFIVVRARSVSELNEVVRATRQGVLASGLRCQLGGGRQRLWYTHQLPGGPGW